MSKPQTESQIQGEFFTRIKYLEVKYPQLKLLHAVPNQGLSGKRGVIHTRKLKAEGLRPGYPDLCYPVKSGGYNSLHIEYKTPKGSLQPSQKTMLRDLVKLGGSCCCICKSADIGVEVVAWYLNGADPKSRPPKSKVLVWF